MKFSWTSDLMDKMWSLYMSGKTFGEIADVLGCSRNAAIGKARRANFTPRDQRPQSSIVFTQRNKKAAPRPMRKAEPVPGKDYRCTIMELTDSRCRYPLWDHGAKKCEYYCGAPGAALSASRPYCSVHMRVCITHKPR